MEMHRLSFCVRVAALASIALGSCSGSASQGSVVADKAGNPPAPVTLSLVTSEVTGTPGLAIVDRFVAAVAEAGNGRITIDVTDSYPPNFPPAWDQEAIRGLREGLFDMAMVPARAWHSEGVETLEPVQLPFLVQTDAQADRVAEDPVADKMLAGLAEIDVTGLGLYPEGIRHIVSLDGAIVAGDGDLAGRKVRAPLADTPWAVLEALGAHPVDLNNDQFEAAVGTGEVTAAESSLRLMANVPASGKRSVLANLTLYTKFQVLAISDAALATLDESTREILNKAANTALIETIAERPHEADALAQACGDSAGTVFASGADLDRIQSAITPVVDRLAADPAVGALIEQVRTAAGDPSTTTLAGCPDTEPVPVQDAVDPDDVLPEAGGLPNGTYRFALDEQTIRAAYPNFPDQQVAFYVGVWTMELRDGHFTLRFLADDPTVDEHDSGVYQVRDNVVSWKGGSGDTAYVRQERWSVETDGSLRFEPVNGRDRGRSTGFTDEVLTLVPWKKIG